MVHLIELTWLTGALRPRPSPHARWEERERETQPAVINDERPMGDTRTHITEDFILLPFVADALSLFLSRPLSTTLSDGYNCGRTHASPASYQRLAMC